VTMITPPRSYWTASDAPAPAGMKKYHLFIDEVNSWNQTDEEDRRIMKLGNDGLTLCLSYVTHYNNSYDSAVCHPIKNIPSTNNITIEGGYFVVPNYLNKSHAVWINTKYYGKGVGDSLLCYDAAGLSYIHGRVNMDDIYGEVSLFRSSIQILYSDPVLIIIILGHSRRNSMIVIGCSNDP
jgi:hypothetical protein